MERLQTEAETPIAPHEVRELLTRLTETKVESMPVDEARTLGGLAVETGIPFDRLQRELDALRGRRETRPLPFMIPAALLAVTLGIGGWLLTSPPTKTAQNLEPTKPPIETPIVETNREGLISLDQVTYGPDSGAYMIEPTFEPTHDVPAGISVSAGIKDVLWGTGDHRAKALKDPLSKAEEQALRQSIEELLAHVRARAGKRDLPMQKGPWDPKYGYDGKAYSVTVMVQSYMGGGSAMVPVPPVGIDDADFKRIARALAKQTVAQLQWQLDFHSKARRPAGP